VRMLNTVIHQGHLLLVFFAHFLVAFSCLLSLFQLLE